MSQSDNRDRVVARFTRTAESFAKFSLTTRSAEAAQLLALAEPRGEECALDLACGPGTFTRAFAPHVRAIHGVDLTPALLAQAQAAAKGAQINLTLTCADAMALPFADAAFDLGICGYSLHHFAQPMAGLRELARVLRAGGSVALVDIIVPDGAEPAAANAIERARDSSHETTFTRAQLESLFAQCGLRIRKREIGERLRVFSDWMRVVGWAPGDSVYQETLRLLELQLGRDTSGFAPHRAPDGDVAFIQTSLFLIAEKS